MNTKHVKSSCCQARVHHFGHRRRQCAACKRTWTIRPRKRGRPSIRVPFKILRQVFLEGCTLRHLAQRRSLTALPAFRHRFRQALRRFLARPYPHELPRGPLVLVADGLWFYFRDKPWILYLTAFKSCSGKTALFLDPVLLPGREGMNKWKKVVAALPPKIRKRIQAIVVDNLPGMKPLAVRYHWLLQLCHFHLILKLQTQRGRQRRALLGGAVREEIYQLIRQGLELPPGPPLQKVLQRLRHLAETSCGTQRIHGMILEYLNSIDYYRTYRNHPKLHLPATTNAAESMGSIIRNLLRRNRCASSPKALQLWATALIRIRPEVACNGKHFNRIH